MTFDKFSRNSFERMKTAKWLPSGIAMNSLRGACNAAMYSRASDVALVKSSSPCIKKIGTETQGQAPWPKVLRLRDEFVGAEHHSISVVVEILYRTTRSDECASDVAGQNCRLLRRSSTTSTACESRPPKHRVVGRRCAAPLKLVDYRAPALCQSTRYSSRNSFSRRRQLGRYPRMPGKGRDSVSPSERREPIRTNALK